MSTVRGLLDKKGTRVWTIDPGETVYKALELMADKNLGALVVLEAGQVAGIFSERDYARKVILKGKSSKTALVGELMTREMFYVSPDATIENCMALMTENRVRYLPVLEEGQLAGIVSIGDAVKEIISDHEIVIRELEHYITGGHDTAASTHA